ncbi:hypothetical protein [Paracidovorax citrulli]
MTRFTHHNKEIEAGLRFTERHGWRVDVRGSHAWGWIYCPYNDAQCRCGEFCVTSIWSTPRSPENHARALRRVVQRCSAHRDWHALEGGNQD